MTDEFDLRRFVGLTNGVDICFDKAEKKIFNYCSGRRKCIQRHSNY